MTPSTTGMRTSISTTSGANSRGLLHGRVGARCRLPSHHREIGVRPQHHPQPGSHQLLVVDDEYAQRAGHVSGGHVSGSRAVDGEAAVPGRAEGERAAAGGNPLGDSGQAVAAGPRSAMRRGSVAGVMAARRRGGGDRSGVGDAGSGEVLVTCTERRRL